MKNKNEFKIFVIDENIFCQDMHQQHLFVLGYEDVFLFTEGSACLQKLSHQPDIIIVNEDAAPEITLELIEKIKRFNRDIYIILLLEKESKSIISAATKAGVFAYVVKTEHQLERIKMVLGSIHQDADLVKRKF